VLGGGGDPDSAEGKSLVASFRKSKDDFANRIYRPSYGGNIRGGRGGALVNIAAV